MLCNQNCILHRTCRTNCMTQPVDETMEAEEFKTSMTQLKFARVRLRRSLLHEIAWITCLRDMIETLRRARGLHPDCAKLGAAGSAIIHILTSHLPEALLIASTIKSADTKWQPG